MTDYFKHRKYFVYRHVAPNGKMYIGITGKSDPIYRWGTGGICYKKNVHFWRAIQKYGWDNFQHIIVAHGLSVDTACHLEEYLIKKYDSMTNGYNQTSGGIYPTEVTDEIRDVIRQKVKQYHSNLPAGEWSKRFMGHTLNEAAKRKISAKAKGRKKSPEVIARQVATFKKNLTPESRYKMGSAFRGKHLSETAKRKISIANTGRIISEDAKARLSKSLCETYANSDRLWVHNECNERWIDTNDLENYLSSGYAVGRRNIKNIYVSKDDITIKITETDFDFYLSQGWVRGFDTMRYKNLSKAKQKFIYTYKGEVFNTGKELANYLRGHGYPKIVQGTINNICQGKTVLAYPELSTEIKRSIRDENR